MFIANMICQNRIKSKEMTDEYDYSQMYNFFVVRICEASFPVYMDMVVHARHNHFVQTIDISSTQLEEVR